MQRPATPGPALTGFSWAAAARRLRSRRAQVTAVGAFERATVGWFDRSARKYQPISVDEQCEVLSLLGDVAVGADGPHCTCTPSSACPTAAPGAGTC